MDPITIADKDFDQLIAGRTKKLLALSSHISKCPTGHKILVRPLVGELLSQSVQIEELLDAYGARNNCRWCAFRFLTAMIKLFSDVSYELLHIQHSLPAYRLLPIEHDFVKATDKALAFTQDVLLRTANQILNKARQLGLPIPSEEIEEKIYAEQLPPGRLPHDCNTSKIGTVSETVSLIATAFLNLAAESEHIHAAAKARQEDYASYISESVSEENLRGLQLRFHNLQSLYDTYVSGTQAEMIDANLPVLRGHISVVFHLFKTATLFAHHYERHINTEICDLPQRQMPLVTREELLAILMNYSVAYISCYITRTERLCKDMLKRYIEVGRIEVPIPPYRGFHVRPATLISKLVLHYGSEVRMELEGESYDAASPLELFRANEKINAHKRRRLSAEIASLELICEDSGNKSITDSVQGIIKALAKQNKLIIYEQPLQLPQNLQLKEGTLLEQTIDEIARLLAIGKIDINVNLKAKFIGDKRVLADIELLAESGYGEDNFGNNISLPKELAYLRH